MIKIFWFLLIFLVVRFFLFRFLIPVMRLTRMTHQRMKEMKHEMNQKANQTRKQQKIEGEYIDYEEIKS